jgi:lipopolysaccharide export LptBFGC system permease protein LptF
MALLALPIFLVHKSNEAVGTTGAFFYALYKFFYIIIKGFVSWNRRWLHSEFLKR